MRRDLVLQARLAMVSSSLTTVQRVLGDLEQARDLNSTDAATGADAHRLADTVEAAVKDLREAKSESDCADRAESIARRLEDDLKEWRAELANRARASRSRVSLRGTRVDNDLGVEVEERLTELRLIEKTVNEAEGANEEKLSKAWLAYAKWSATCVKVFKDYVDLVRGVLLRDSGLDNDLCRIADKLVEQSGKWKDYEWGSFTIPTSDDHGDVSSLRLVRIGFPEWSVWALPLTMYEIGHLFAEINPKVRPLIDDARRRSENATEVHLANDDLTVEERARRITSAGNEAATRYETWIAEAYATAKLGPAYVWATVLLRADPTSDVDDRRIAVMLEMLRLVEESEGVQSGTDEFKNERKRLQEEWSAARAQVTGSGDVVAADDSIVTIVKDVRTLITSAFGPKAWAEALTITDQLEAGKPTPKIAAGREVGYLHHVLAAAWKARIRLADQRFEAPADLTGDRLDEARQGAEQIQLGQAHELARRTREVCVAIIDAEQPTQPTNTSVVTTAFRPPDVEDVSIDKTRSLSPSDSRLGA